MTQWYAVRTATRRERVALAGLEARGLTCFLPMAKHWSRLQRGPQPQKVERPVIPGYLFVLCDPEDFRLILDSEAVSAFVEATGSDGVDFPMPFPLKDVLQLQVEEASGAYDFTRAVKVRYRPRKGDRVKVIAGPYLRFFAKVLSTPKGDRVHVMMEGPQPRGQTLNANHIEAAA